MVIYNDIWYYYYDDDDDEMMMIMTTMRRIQRERGCVGYAPSVPRNRLGVLCLEGYDVSKCDAATDAVPLHECRDLEEFL